MKLDANSRLALKLAAGALAMFGFGYALVPMYEVFCEATGLRGTTGQITDAEAERTQLDPNRVVKVRFDANVNENLPWKFAPLQQEIEVHPGQLTEAFYVAENTAPVAIVGQAVPSIVPAKGSPYFNKTECFCFTQQTLAAGERRKMPIRFVVDPDLPDDVRSMVLSYTFFAAPGSVAHAALTTGEKADAKQGS